MEEPPEAAAVYRWLVHEAHEVAERIMNRLRHLNRARVFTKEEVQAIEALGVELTEAPEGAP
jgi:hypothetical protein